MIETVRYQLTFRYIQTFKIVRTVSFCYYCIFQNNKIINFTVKLNNVRYFDNVGGYDNLKDAIATIKVPSILLARQVWEFQQMTRLLRPSRVDKSIKL